MKNRILTGNILGICPNPCDHRICNDTRLYEKLGINPFGVYENNKEESHAEIQRPRLEAH